MLDKTLVFIPQSSLRRKSIRSAASKAEKRLSQQIEVCILVSEHGCICGLFHAIVPVVTVVSFAKRMTALISSASSTLPKRN